MRTTTKLKINALVYTVIAAGMAISAANPGASFDTNPGGNAESIRPVAPGSPQALIAKHDCHTDGIHDTDRSAIVTLPGATGPIWTAEHPRGERIWGRVVFDQMPEGTTVHATCEATR